MENITKCIKTVVIASFLIAGLGLCLAPLSARADFKEIKIAIGVGADTFNPQEQTTSLFMNICDLIYDTLFYQTPDLKLEPRLATRYEVSKDGLTYTVHLRKGVKFTDGTPFNALAMKLTIDRAVNTKQWKTRVPLRFAIAMIEEVTIVDDYTIQIKLEYAFAPFAATLSLVTLSPISPTALFKYGEDVRRKPVGAGPYVLKEWVAGDRIVLVGKLASMSKRDAAQLIREHGGSVVDRLRRLADQLADSEDSTGEDSTGDEVPHPQTRSTPLRVPVVRVHDSFLLSHPSFVPLTSHERARR